MPSSKTISKGIRITNEAALYFDGMPLNRMIEGMIPLLESGELVYDGEKLKISGKSGVHTGNVEEAIGEFEEMAACCGMTTEELVGGLLSLLEEGAVVIDNGALTTAKSGWVTDFENACHDLCIPVEKAAAGAIKNLKRGDL